MPKRILLVRHNAGPYDDRVTNFCALNGFAADIRAPFRGEKLGGVTDDLAGMVVYGGPYNADAADTTPFLNEEYRMIGAVMDAGLPLLGLCQGAQMIAYHLGAFAGAPDHGLHEFGYYEVEPTGADPDFLPGPLHFTQWHFHTFDIPKEAIHLARSAAFENQAFRVGKNVYGLQFHPEQTVEGFRRWQNIDPGSYTRPGVQTRDRQTALMHEHDAAQAMWFYSFLGQLFVA